MRTSPVLIPGWVAHRYHVGAHYSPGSGAYELQRCIRFYLFVIFGFYVFHVEFLPISVEVNPYGCIHQPQLTLTASQVHRNQQRFLLFSELL